MRRVTALIGGAAVVLLAGAFLATPAEAAPSQPVRYHSCTQLNRVFHHGVGLPGAFDQVRGHAHRVTNYTRNVPAYNRNRHLDADHDGIACERR